MDPINQFCDYLAPLQITSGTAKNQEYLVTGGKVNLGISYTGTASLSGSFGGNDNCQTAFERILQACDQNQDTKRGGLSKDTDGAEVITLYVGTASEFGKHVTLEDAVAALSDTPGSSLDKRDQDWGICWPTTSKTNENEFQSASDLFCNYLRGLPLNASDYPTVQSYVISSGNILFEVNFNDSDSSGSVTVGFTQCFEITEQIRTQCDEQDGQHGGRWFHAENGGTFELAIYPNIPQTKAAVKRDMDLDHSRLTCWSGEPSHSVDDVNQAAQSYCTDLWPKLLQSQGGKVWKAYSVPGGDVEFSATWNPASRGLYTTTASCIDHINAILQFCDQAATQTQGGEMNVTSSNGFLIFNIFTTLNDRKPVFRDVAVNKRQTTLSKELKRYIERYVGPTSPIHEGAVNVECGAAGVSASTASVLLNGGQFCASVITHPWNDGQMMNHDAPVTPTQGIRFHMEYHGTNGALLSGATCESWLRILTTQCPLSQGGGIEMKTWTFFVAPYNGPSWANWAFSKNIDPAQSKTVNISDFNVTSPGAGNSSSAST